MAVLFHAVNPGSNPGGRTTLTIFIHKIKIRPCYIWLSNIPAPTVTSIAPKASFGVTFSRRNVAANIAENNGEAADSGATIVTLAKLNA